MELNQPAISSSLVLDDPTHIPTGFTNTEGLASVQPAFSGAIPCITTPPAAKDKEPKGIDDALLHGARLVSLPIEPPLDPMPLPLHREQPQPPPFPIDSLGKDLRDVIQGVHHVTQAPLATCAQSTIAAINQACHSLRDIEVDGRRFPPSLYLATVGESGDRKTAVDTIALRPQREYEKELRAQYDIDFAKFKNDHEIYELGRKGALKSSKDLGEIQNSLDALGGEPRPPLLPLLLVEEPTYEGLVNLFVNGLPSLGLFSNEAGRMIGGYSMNDQNELKTSAGLSELWDGKPISRVRVGDGSKILVGRRLCAHLMMQPLVSERLLNNPVLKDQGLTSRILAAFPESTIGSRPYRSISAEQIPAVTDFWLRMGSMLRLERDTVVGKPNELDPPIIGLEADAKELWVNFYNQIELQLGKGSALEAIRGFGSKIAEQALRLAATIQLYHCPASANISLDAIQQGIALAEFYILEALRLQGAAAVSPELRLAKQVLDWAIPLGRFTNVQLYQAGCSSAIRTAATARRIVAILIDHGWLFPIEGGLKYNGSLRKDAWRVARVQSI